MFLVGKLVHRLKEAPQDSGHLLHCCQQTHYVTQTANKQAQELFQVFFFILDFSPIVLSF